MARALRCVGSQSFDHIAARGALVPGYLKQLARNQTSQGRHCRLDELVAQRVGVVETLVAQVVHLLIDAVQSLDNAIGVRGNTGVRFITHDYQSNRKKWDVRWSCQAVQTRVEA